MRDLADILSGPLRRTVIDQTEIVGRFDIHLELPDDLGRSPDETARDLMELVSVVVGISGMRKPFAGQCGSPRRRRRP